MLVHYQLTGKAIHIQNHIDTRAYLLRVPSYFYRGQPTIPTAHYSDSPLFRHPTIPTLLNPLFREPTIPTDACR